jgi:hypothetical protein
MAANVWCTSAVVWATRLRYVHEAPAITGKYAVEHAPEAVTGGVDVGATGTADEAGGAVLLPALVPPPLVPQPVGASDAKTTAAHATARLPLTATLAGG